jgi:hypothetical protein
MWFPGGGNVRLGLGWNDNSAIGGCFSSNNNEGQI